MGLTETRGKTIYASKNLGQNGYGGISRRADRLGDLKPAGLGRMLKELRLISPHRGLYPFKQGRSYERASEKINRSGHSPDGELSGRGPALRLSS